ncbi:MAG TPA: Eco57I restriction-modification methylase domain-containing protein [Verrucomicrobiae bacterium]|nr:Eco57I restriction-modification methylase domain-containing protein [Verrucomicrobiae bacterium]
MVLAFWAGNETFTDVRVERRVNRGHGDVTLRRPDCSIATYCQLCYPAFVLSAVISESAARRRQGELGQFLTPAPVADFMASLFGPLPNALRVLDAGAGAGALTAALVSRLCEKKGGVHTIEATLYEIDPHIQDALLEKMQACQRISVKAGIQFSFTIHESDFIQEMSACLGDSLFGRRPPLFDAAIVNPPYRKISTGSAERRHLRHVGVETSNLYAGFIAIIQRLLAPGGQLVAITPRSFCNGPYFRAFREDLLANLEVHRLHVFESREAAFRDDSVLQENIIFHAVKGHKQPGTLVVSSSSGKHGDSVVEAKIPFAEVVHKNDSEKFIHIPSASGHAGAKKVMDGLRASLAMLGITVSTGRVVDFRLKEALRMKPEKGTVPLLYPCHFNGGTVHWPKPDARKPNAILDNDETRPWLVKSGIYLLTKRFTSKEERRRLVACIFDPQAVEAEWLGFENHLNYFHADGHGLDRDLAVGLFAFLNSTVVDQYFRRFSGHTQVNATDLRKLAYPDRETLKAMGSALKQLDQPQEALDTLVEKFLHAQQ